MTNEEALELLKDHEYLADISVLDEMAEVAIKALERQTPKNSLNAMIDNGFVVHACPNCESLVVSIMNYCPDCGQRLNWEVKE